VEVRLVGVVGWLGLLDWLVVDIFLLVLSWWSVGFLSIVSWLGLLDWLVVNILLLVGSWSSI
jgi:hypothetical protein